MKMSSRDIGRSYKYIILNVLKNWEEPEWLMSPISNDPKLGPVSARLDPRREGKPPVIREHTAKAQRGQLRRLIKGFEDVFTKEPRKA